MSELFLKNGSGVAVELQEGIVAEDRQLLKVSLGGHNEDRSKLLVDPCVVVRRNV